MYLSICSVINTVSSHIFMATKLDVFWSSGRYNSIVTKKVFINHVTMLALIFPCVCDLKEDKIQWEKYASAEQYALKKSLMNLPFHCGMILKYIFREDSNKIIWRTSGHGRCLEIKEYIIWKWKVWVLVY